MSLSFRLAYRPTGPLHSPLSRSFRAFNHPSSVYSTVRLLNNGSAVKSTQSRSIESAPASSALGLLSSWLFRVVAAAKPSLEMAYPMAAPCLVPATVASSVNFSVARGVAGSSPLAALALARSRSHGYPSHAHGIFSARHFSSSSNLLNAKSTPAPATPATPATPTPPPPPPEPETPETPETPKKSVISTIIYGFRFLVTAVATSIVSLLGLVLLFFIYDYTTYAGDDDERDVRVQVPDLALNPRRGGPKNLPIYEAALDDYDSDELRAESQKPRLVVLGTGWGIITLLKQMYSKEYDVIVISPTNYFLFTPLLPSATVGTLEARSLVEPIRNILKPLAAHYLLAQAEDILFDEQLVEVSAYDPGSKEQRRFYVPYDRVVVGVGSVSNNHGVKGLEHCLKLKTVDDVSLIRKKVVENIEAACLPTTTDQERKKLLSFVVCGGGPTGVELAAELFDTVREDLKKRYPKIVQSEVSVHIIQSRSHILNTYDESISNYAEARFSKDGVDVVINSRVKEVLPDRVTFTQKLEDGSRVDREIPFGMCIWSTGVDKTELTRTLTDRLGPQYQKNQRAIETDTHLRIIGAPLGTAYAIGDCATVRTNLVQDIQLLLHEGVVNNMKYTYYEDDEGEIVQVTERAADATGMAGSPNDTSSNFKQPFKTYQHSDDIRTLKLSYEDFIALANAVKEREPRTAVHLTHVKELFSEYDNNHDGVLSYEELCELLTTIDSKVTSLPATAQRAAQQGKYLGRKLRRLISLADTYASQEFSTPEFDETGRVTSKNGKNGGKQVGQAADDIDYHKHHGHRWGGLRPLFPNCPSHLDLDEAVFRPFVYRHLGSLAYIGNAAVFDLNGTHYFGGILSMYLWRGAYFAQTVGFRTRCLMFMDWLKRGMFGRDLSGV